MIYRAEDYEGTRVGPSIVKRIIKRHGGRIWADSQQGNGATFYFAIAALPRTTGASDPRQA